MILDKEFPPDPRVENEAMSLIKAGFEVHLLCFTFIALAKFEEYNKIKIHRIFIPKQIYKKLSALILTFPFYNWFWKRKIGNFVKDNKIDILHIHDLPLCGVGLEIKNKHNIPLVADMHENYPFALKYYAFTNTFLGRLLISVEKWKRKEIEWCNKADYLITVIEEAVERYKLLGIPEEKITVVANYVNQKEFLSCDDNFEILDKFKDKFVITYIGGFDTHRGLESVIKAMPNVIKESRNIKLVLVGQGKNLNELISLSKSLGVDKYISFEGWQPPSKLPSYIKASDVCLIPHLKTVHTDNTIPHKLFQYMLLEKPVVATNCNPIKRIVEETGCGLIYENENVHQLANTIIKLYNDQPLRHEMGANGKRSVLEKYNWENTSKNLIRLYEDIERELATEKT